LDIRLRRGETVFALAQELRKRHIPFGLVTAHARDVVDPDYANEMVLEKPFFNEDLTAFTESRLGRGMRTH
jgi:hypothetical protein